MVAPRKTLVNYKTRASIQLVEASLELLHNHTIFSQEVMKLNLIFNFKTVKMKSRLCWNSFKYLEKFKYDEHEFNCKLDLYIFKKIYFSFFTLF